MKAFKRSLSMMLTVVMLLSTLSINMTVSADEAEVISGEEVTEAEKVEEVTDTEFATAEKAENEVIDTEIAEVPSTVTERGMQFKIDNLEDVKTIRYAYGEHETEKDIKYGEGAVSHSAKTLRKRGDSCVLQFLNPGLVSIVITYNDGTRDFYKYEVIKSEPTVTRDGSNNITFGNLDDLKVLRFVKGKYESSYDIKRANGSVSISGKNIDSDTYTVTLDRETYTFCVQYNDESYNYYVTGICGDNLTWVYDMQSAALTISGEGEMDDYYKNMPWYDFLSEIKKVQIGEGVTYIGNYAFTNGVSITEVHLPNTLEWMMDSCFEHCTSLESVTIPDNVVSIDSNVFRDCTSLKSVKIGDGVTMLLCSAFQDCTALTEVKFGKSIELIDCNAFSGCKSLYDINLQRSDIEIYEGAFSESGLYYNRENWENGILYLDTYLIDSKYAYDDVHNLVIRDGTITIAQCALVSVRADYVYIPKSITKICGSGLPCNPETTFMVYENSFAHNFVLGRKYQIIPE